MKNEIVRVYEDKNIIIYERVGREEKGISKYFSSDGLEFRDIRGVKAFIKSLKTENKVIKITIEGGVLQDVENLPEGWTYELNDLDDLGAEEE